MRMAPEALHGHAMLAFGAFEFGEHFVVPKHHVPTPTFPCTKNSHDERCISLT